MLKKGRPSRRDAERRLNEMRKMREIEPKPVCPFADRAPA
jgi:hypothetical protein